MKRAFENICTYIINPTIKPWTMNMNTISRLTTKKWVLLLKLIKLHCVAARYCITENPFPRKRRREGFSLAVLLLAMMVSSQNRLKGSDHQVHLLTSNNIFDQLTGGHIRACALWTSNKRLYLSPCLIQWSMWPAYSSSSHPLSQVSSQEHVWYSQPSTVNEDDTVAY